MVLGGVLLFVKNINYNSSILGVVIGILGVLTFTLEFVIPEVIVYNMGFMFSLLGRGVCNVGCLCLKAQWFNIVVGSVIMAIGVFYVVMHFVGATPSPSMSAVPSTVHDTLNPGTSGAQYTNPSTNVDQPSMTQTYQSPNPDSQFVGGPTRV
ncbi:Late Golgi vesicles protein [Dissophora globulifera]|uniref:Late Golgi vesicles protein n=1 Tax=Dissophora globulifera TaxID=979702 RepID=A0A9P6RHK9_9FUNG|nr:Late Golgi vesicles protein [Dissophora globulifera]